MELKTKNFHYFVIWLFWRLFLVLVLSPVSIKLGHQQSQLSLLHHLSTIDEALSCRIKSLFAKSRRMSSREHLLITSGGMLSGPDCFPPFRLFLAFCSSLVVKSPSFMFISWRNGSSSSSSLCFGHVVHHSRVYC